ncbi:MAG TPA: penicillin-binding protein 2 [Candidatus Saccharimonadales bacterium]|nr:penicillin-binding protein 2 [Candidatus Saccharimonadales bacterium]
MALPNKNDENTSDTRVRIWYGALLLILGIFVIQLFNMQVIHYGHYKAAALSDQLEQYQIPATRGLIEAHEGGSVVPIVLNQKLYTLYVDPTLVKDANKYAAKIAGVLNINQSALPAQISKKNTRYVILAKKITEDQSNKILAYRLPGVGTQGKYYRVYPDGSMASQVLGFVNSNGVGEYGMEQALNIQLAGKPGKLKAVTDANGVPLAASKGNIDVAPINGDDIISSLDVPMQSQMEQILAQEYKKTNSQGLSAIIMDPYTGKIKAMANYPTYDPSNYENVANPKLFENAAVDYPIEPGSTMKTLTTSAALDVGAITPDETFYDPAHWVINGFNITDIEQDGGAREQSIASTLALSLNTGATWMLMQMSQKGATNINQKGIDTWHNYMVNRFRLGQPTGIEQGYEASGYVPPADMTDPSIDLTYANTAFGQGVQLTALQELAALSSVLNGGTYYQPSLVDQTVTPDGKTIVNNPKVLERNVVSPQVGQELIPLMENVVTSYLHEGFGFMNFPSNYMVGGKTGTAQLAQPGGGYYANIFNGTYIGFVGGNKPKYAIVVFNIKPNVPGYAGSLGGQPVFADIAHMLINEGYVSPKN